MDSEIEYEKWLCRKEKTFEENLQFAIKSLKSSEFLLTSKYEIALKWFNENFLHKIKEEQNNECPIKNITVDWKLIIEFLEINFSPGLITVETKQSFIEKWIKFITSSSSHLFTNENDYSSIDYQKNLNKILFLLCEHNSYQDLYKFSNELYCELIKTLLKVYESYIDSINLNEICINEENDFFLKVLNNLKTFILNISSVDKFEKSFNQIILQSLFEIYIKLKSKNMNYFNEIYEIVKLVYFQNDDVGKKKVIINELKKFIDLPIYINLLYYEFCITYYREHKLFLGIFIQFIFENLNEYKNYENIQIQLITKKHIIDLLRKYDVTINFELENNSKRTLLQYLSDNLKILIENNYKTNLKLTLLILCSIIKLNPLLIEKNIFDILIKIMLIQKDTKEIYKIYEKFLILIIDMFKKLNRNEKFISHLLKTIKEYLKMNKLSKKCKRKLKAIKTNDDDNENDESKKLKLSSTTLMSSSTINVSDNSLVDESMLDLSKITNVDDDEMITYLISNFYLNSLCNEFNDIDDNNHSVNNNINWNHDRDIEENWTNISFAWPINTIDIQFIKFITSLVSKPSLVIWKTLVYNLNEILDDFDKIISKDQTSLPSSLKIDENLLFFIDFTSQLLCQYFLGTKLSEQFDKFSSEIHKNALLTNNLLNKFGKLILNYEHNNRLMITFLKININYNDFKLLLLYYCSDLLLVKDLSTAALSSFDLKNLINKNNNFYDYLSLDEWILIEQRIINFGNIKCKNYINNLYIQKIKTKLLFSNIFHNYNVNDFQITDRDDVSKLINAKKYLLSSTLNDIEQIKNIFKIDNKYEKVKINSGSGYTNTWLLNYLNCKDKIELCSLFLTDLECLNYKFLYQFVEIYDFYEIILINLYKLIGNCFVKSKKSILNTIDFDKLLKITEHNDIDEDSTNNMNVNKFNEIIQKICEKSDLYSIKKYSSEELYRILEILNELPIGYCKSNTKSLLYILNVALFRDLLATNDNQLIEKCFTIFTDLLHFGEPIQIFNYFDIENLLKFFPIDLEVAENSSIIMKFYELIFATFKKIINNAELCLIKITKIFSTPEILKINENYLKFMIKLIESLSMQQIIIKKFKKYQDELITIFMDYVNEYFNKADENDDDDNNDNKTKVTDKRNSENDKKFVLKTLSAYTIYIASYFGKISSTNKNANSKNNENNIENIEKSNNLIDENIRRICKIYIGYSMDCNNTYSIKLLNTALAYKIPLHFDPDEIEFVLEEYWKQLQMKFENGDTIDMKNVEILMKLIMNHQSIEDFHRILINLTRIASNDNKTEYVCQILLQMSKCYFNTLKGAILNEYFKKIIFNIIIKLEKESNSNQFKYSPTILHVLDCEKILCENHKIPMSIDHIDMILIFLMDLNIKKFKLNDDNSTKIYFKLASNVIDLCLILIKFRYTLLFDRIPQFMYVFKDLLQSICLYKSERKLDIQLNNDELNDLEELSLKLENLMHLMTSHNLEMKKIAPYVLMFIINLMVSSKKPTTLYPKIKSRVESICYDLISLCDHRVGSFILRCSNDATKQIYESLRKDHQKYKFKGKV